MRILNLIVISVCLFLGQLAAEDAVKVERLSDIVTMPDRPRAFYKVFFIGSDPLICSFVEVNEEDKTITYAEAGNTIKITKTTNRLSRVEPRISPAELIVGRGAELLLAYTYEGLHLDAQRELMKLLTWGTETEQISFGGEDVPAPVKECADLAIQAALQYPHNHNILNIMLKTLTDSGDERLEQSLIETLKVAPKWDEGYEAIAEILEKDARDQDLLSFVRKWVDLHKASVSANQWAMRIGLLNNDTDMAKEAARRLWLRKKIPAAGAELAKILLMENKGEEALGIANDVLALDGSLVEMKIIAGSALLAQSKFDEALELLNQAKNSPDEKLQAMAKHNLGVLSWLRGDMAEAKEMWRDLDHPASKLARAIVQRKPIQDRGVLDHPAMSMIAGELNAALALENENAAKAKLSLRPNHSTRHTFLDRVADLIQSNYSTQEIKLLSTNSGDEAILWRAYGFIRQGQYAQAEAALQGLPKEHGYAAVYRVYCAEGLGDAKRAEELFEIAKESQNPPAIYLSELESHYLTMKSSKELENFNWPEGDRLKTGWFSEAPNTGIHIFASGEYLAFTGVQKETNESRAWRKRSKERLRKIRAKIDPTQGWSGIELMDDKSINGIAIAIELINSDKKFVWRRMSDGKWGDTWNTVGEAKENQITLMLDDSLIGNEQIQLLDSNGSLVPLASLSDVPGMHMRVGFFVLAPSDTEVNFKARELLFEVRPQE